MKLLHSQPLRLFAALSLLAAAPLQAGFTNPGFESPAFSTGVHIVAESTVPGWKTTASDHQIEFWTNTTPAAYEGKQFVELNANFQGALYQEISGIAAGSAVGFKFAHRGRAGTETMKLTITDLGANGAVGGGDDTVLFTKNYSDGTAAWVQYTSVNEPLIIARGNKVRFQFESLNSGSVGNFLDDCDFGVNVVTTAPITDAGPDQTVAPGAQVTLNGSASHDTNNPPKPIAYSWSQLSGTAVTLLNPTSATPSFTAPGAPSAGTALVFKLTVSNGVTTPSTDTVTVNIAKLNSPPTANAGGAQTIPENTLVTLHGSGSDPDGDQLTLTWTQVGGTPVSLVNADSPEPTFTAPAITNPQGSADLTFRLVVNDGKASSGPSEVTVHVINVNSAPVANAGTGLSVNEFEPVSLNGQLSSDPEGDALTYAWTQIAGSPAVALSGADTATPSFTAPEVSQGGVTLSFQLTVNDGALSSSATVNVRVSNINHLPLADAGADQTVPENKPVNLSGANSADEDGDVLTYSWVQIDGAPVALTGANTATPGFTTPDVGPAGATLVFRLTVDDNYGGIATDEVTVKVSYVNHPPTVSVGDDFTVNEGATAQLSATAADEDGNELAYAWTQLSGPAVTLLDASGATPSFLAPPVTRAEADVVLQVTVTDGFGGAASDDVTVHLANINHAPVAQAPANLTVAEGTSVELIGQGLDSDSEEQSQLTYSWQQIAPTVGAAIPGATLQFNAPLVTAGGDPEAKVTLAFRLTVTDPNGASDSQEVGVVVANVEHAPTAITGGNLTVNEGASVTLNGSASSDPDGDALTYAWTQIAGPAVALSDAHTAFPYFTAPFVNAAGATLKFKLTVTDGFGGSSCDTSTVTVLNINDPPATASAQPSLGTLWPPDHSLVKITINGVVDPNSNATITITGVTQDEPTNGLGDGDTAIDAIISADGASVLLRSERAGKGDGRVYRVSFTASDFEGSSSGTALVSVPHDKKGDPARDSGGTYNSTR